MRVRSARCFCGPLIRFGTEAEADNVDNGIGIVQLPAKHFLDGAVIRRKARLVFREAAFFLNLGFHRIAEGT